MGLKDFFSKKKEKDKVVNIQRDAPAGWDKNSVSLPQALKAQRYRYKTVSLPKSFKAQQYRQKSQQIDEEIKRLVEDEKRYNYLVKQIKEFDNVAGEGEIKKINKDIDKNARKLEKERIVERKKLLEKTKQNLTGEYERAIQKAERDSDLDKLKFIEQTIRSSTFFYDYPRARKELSKKLENAHARIIDNIIGKESKISENTRNMAKEQGIKRLGQTQRKSRLEPLDEIMSMGGAVEKGIRPPTQRESKLEEAREGVDNFPNRNLGGNEPLDEIMSMGGAVEKGIRPPTQRESKIDTEKMRPGSERPKGSNKKDNKEVSEGTKCPGCGKRDLQYTPNTGRWYCPHCGKDWSRDEVFPSHDAFSEIARSSFIPVAIAAFVGLMIPVIFGANVGTALIAVGIIFLGLSKI